MPDNEPVEALEDRVEELAASVEDIGEDLATVKDAVDTDKEPGEAEGDGALRSLAAELANHDDVMASAEDIIADLKSEYLSDKEDDDEDDEDMGEMPDGDDDEEKTEGDDDGGAAETEKSTDDDATPNYGKGGDGGDAAQVAKDAQGSGAQTVPSYAAAAEQYEEEEN